MTKRKVPISELLKRYGDEHVRIQNLLECAVNAVTRHRGGTAVTFMTSEITPNALLDHADGRPTETIGLVVWLNRTRVEAILQVAELEPEPKP